MNDDIELPPLPNYSEWLCDEIQKWGRAAVMADRQKREKPGRVVREVCVKLVSDCPAGNLYRLWAKTEEPAHVVTLKWDDSRAWIDSEWNRELARRLRRFADGEDGAGSHVAASRLREAADALDGGEAK